MTATPLFVIGVGRSGTTTLASLLSSHPRVVIGQERYKALWGRRIAELTPACFTRERFFDFGDGLTNIVPSAEERWRVHYERMDAQFDEASYVGDKLTVARLQVLWEQHPDARFVCIVRDVAEVAASWDRRATTVTDRGWPESLDARRAVEFWNQHNTRIRRAARQRPEQVAVVEYASFFGDAGAGALRRVLAGLGLDMAPEVETAFAAAHARYADVVAQERSLSAEGRAFLEEHADLQLWRSLRRLAR